MIIYLAGNAVLTKVAKERLYCLFRSRLLSYHHVRKGQIHFGEWKWLREVLICQ